MLDQIVEMSEQILQKGEVNEGAAVGLAAVIGAGLTYCAINGVVERYRSVAKLGEEEKKKASYQAPEAKRSQQI